MPLDVEVEEALLSRFAYKSTITRPPYSGPSRPTQVVRKDPPADLPDAQLVRLSKCVACRLQWTSRKSAKQKRAHIEQCAKKNALTKDTIRCLIEQEIALVSPTNGAGENEATLMDSVVPPGPSKKPRRQQVVPTVRSLQETRESILNRASDILGPTNAQPDPHPTQQFGQSALACRKALLPKRSAFLDVNVCADDEPPLTQPFGASALHQGTIASGHMECSSLHQQYGSSLFAQGAVSSNDRKRPASPLLDSNAKTTRQRLQ